MPALQVRDFPDELYRELKSFAAANHRSIAQQTIACVEETLARNGGSPSAKAPLKEDFTQIDIEVAKAAHRAKAVDAFAWKLGLSDEPEEIRTARRKKRAGLQKQAKALRDAWNGGAPSPGEVAKLIREERDARSETLAAHAEAVR